MALIDADDDCDYDNDDLNGSNDGDLASPSSSADAVESLAEILALVMLQRFSRSAAELNAVDSTCNCATVAECNSDSTEAADAGESTLAGLECGGIACSKRCR